MARTITCVKLGPDAEGLDFPIGREDDLFSRPMEGVERVEQLGDGGLLPGEEVDVVDAA